MYDTLYIVEYIAHETWSSQWCREIREQILQIVAQWSAINCYTSALYFNPWCLYKSTGNRIFAVAMNHETVNKGCFKPTELDEQKHWLPINDPILFLVAACFWQCLLKKVAWLNENISYIYEINGPPRDLMSRHLATVINYLFSLLPFFLHCFLSKTSADPCSNVSMYFLGYLTEYYILHCTSQDMF